MNVEELKELTYLRTLKQAYEIELKQLKIKYRSALIQLTHYSDSDEFGLTGTIYNVFEELKSLGVTLDILKELETNTSYQTLMKELDETNG